MEHDASPLNNQCKRCGKFTHETGPECEVETRQDSSLQSLWEEVNALGGYRPTERNYEQGYVDAISAALEIIEKCIK